MAMGAWSLQTVLHGRRKAVPSRCVADASQFISCAGTYKCTLRQRGVAVAGKGGILPRKLGIRNLGLGFLERCVSGSGPSAPVLGH